MVRDFPTSRMDLIKCEVKRFDYTKKEPLFSLRHRTKFIFKTQTFVKSQVKRKQDKDQGIKNFKQIAKSYDTTKKTFSKQAET